MSGNGSYRSISLADGTATLRIPGEWPEPKVGWSSLLVGGRFEYEPVIRIDVGSFDDEEAVRSGNLSLYMAGEDGKDAPVESSAMEDFLLILHRDEQGRPTGATLRRADTLPPRHVRFCEGRLDFPNAWQRLEDFKQLVTEISGVFASLRLADSVTALDRLAPEEGYSLSGLAERLYIRLPGHWRVERTNDDNDGHDYCIEDSEDDDAFTIWLSIREWFEYEPMDGEACAALLQRLRTDLADAMERDSLLAPLRDETLDDGTALLTWELKSIEDGELLRRHHFCRVAVFPDEYAIVTAFFVRLESQIGEPRSDTALSYLEREIRNARVVPGVRTLA